MSSESTLCTELLLDVALDTEETLLTLRDLDAHKPVCTQIFLTAGRAGAGDPGVGNWWGVSISLQFPFLRNMDPPNLKCQRELWVV